MSNPLLVQYDKIATRIKEIPELDKRLHAKVQKINHTVQMNFIQKHEEGYCARFIIPDRDFNNVFSDFPDIKDIDITSAFRLAWKLPSSGAHMHSNVYYQKLCLIAYHAAKTDNNELGNFAVRLILFRIWNGRITKLIKWCNPDIMAAAIANCKSRKFEFKKHETPLDLIQNYLAPTIWIKYKEYILRDISETKRLFEQCFQRVKQMFGSGARKDLKTGETRYQSGLQPFYYRAAEERNKILVSKNDDSDFDNIVTSSDIENLTNSVVTYITLSDQEYDQNVVNEITKKVTGIKRSKILTILEKIHQLKYSDILKDITELFFRKLTGINKQEYCSENYYELIRVRILSSKNNQDIENLKTLIDMLLDQIFRNDLDKVYDDYMQKTINQRSQYRAIIIFGLAYNIKSIICQ